MSKLDRLHSIIELHGNYWSDLANANPKSVMKSFWKRTWLPWYSNWLDSYRHGLDDGGVYQYAHELSALRDHADSQGIPTPDLSGESIRVSGWFDDVKHYLDPQSEFRGEVWDAISPVMEWMPWGGAIKKIHEETYHPDKKETGADMLANAMKIHDTVVAAKKGDKTAQATLAGVKAKADAGDPAAVQALDTAQKINSTLNAKAAKSIQKTADKISGFRIGEVRDHRSGAGSGGVWNTGTHLPPAPPVRSSQGSAYNTPSGALTSNPQNSPPVGYGYAPPPGYMGPNPYGDPSQQGYGDPYAGYGGGYPQYAQPYGQGMNPYFQQQMPQYGYAQTPYGYTDPYSMGYAPSPYDQYGYGYGGQGYQFSGPLYHRPYRASTELVTHHRLRDYYNAGLHS
jgi:hypothetical protein